MVSGLLTTCPEFTWVQEQLPNLAMMDENIMYYFFCIKFYNYFIFYNYFFCLGYEEEVILTCVGDYFVGKRRRCQHTGPRRKVTWAGESGALEESGAKRY